ncbi:MAG: hypothetical protein HYZ53_29230 [Planctomycetes bacterium]|nr:hypothetical protein [Planctomycetota bacterium]
MNERTSRKIPVTDRQFLWVQDDDKGEVTLHVGPTMVSPTAADRVVVDDGEGGFREDVTGKPQSMVELGDNQYAVLYNPLLESDGGPNGKFRPGRNESRPLRNGTRSMIPGPCCFYLRPGQRVEVRDAHKLASNQYLLVEVYGPVDTTAPYYEVTARSATITRSTAERLAEGGPAGASPAPPKPVDLNRGQLIVIRGLDTQFYIPPTGVDIVPDTSVDGTGAALGAAAARQILAQLKQEAPERRAVAQGAIDALAEQVQVAEEGGAQSEAEAQGVPRRAQQAADVYIDQSARARHRKAPVPPSPGGPPAGMPAPASAAAAPNAMFQAVQGAFPAGSAAGGANLAAQASAAAAPPSLAEVLASPTLRRALEKQAGQARLVRNAVVLGEKEYCVLIDADGKREIKVGPARVFPGPYDTFMSVGSRNRVYDAYELLPQRALWLRVISPIARAELAQRLPRAFVLEKDAYFPGDELLLTGVSTFFFPFNEIEVLSPETGQAVVGNDHARIFIEAVGIDQKSGIYVRDLTTGEVRLIRGKQSYLVDPRKEVQITRIVPADDWNLWIAANEPHKRTATAITTPWALSITVPNNTAILVTSANARRVVEGPCVTLLGYEETLCSISLSMGTPKTDDRLLKTCFLRTLGNRVSDVITVETFDFVKVNIRVSYSVTFLAEQREKWFNHENYVQVMCEHLRSLVRSRSRALSLTQLWPQLPALVRDTVLGEPKDGRRPGRSFAENGSVVTEVEVLSAVIENRDVAELMQRVHTEWVTLQIGDRKAQEELASTKLRAELDKEMARLTEEAKEREAKVAEAVRRLGHEARLAELRGGEGVERERQDLTDARESAAQKARVAREDEAKAAELKRAAEEARVQAEAQRTLAAAEVERAARLRDLEVLLINAQSTATVAERNAIQRGLVEAMTALGDKIMLGEVASNMNLVSLYKGKDVGTILSEVLGGTKVLPTLQALRERFGGAGGGSGSGGGADGPKPATPAGSGSGPAAPPPAPGGPSSAPRGRS